MSVNSPPSPNVSTFNNLYWISADGSLTQSQADLRYLKFPVAQGTENLQATNIQGALTCNSTANFASTTAPTSSQTLLSTSDSSTKIPTTAWVQARIATIPSSSGLVAVNFYTSTQTITPPANTYKFDVMVFGSGGNAGSVGIFGSYLVFGGAGAGGNAAKAESIPWNSSLTLSLVVTPLNVGGNSTTLTFGSLGTAICYNGGNGSSGSSGGGGAAGVANTTPNSLPTNIASWVSYYGQNGSGGGSYSYPAGFPNPPNTIGGGIANTSYTSGSGQIGVGRSYVASTDPIAQWSDAPYTAGGCIITWYKTA